MAQKVQVTLVDDLDGSSADETLTFGLDGVSYEIDLSKGNAKKFRDSLNAYVGAARRSGRAAARRSSPWSHRPQGCCWQPGTDVRHPGLGTDQGHQGQRARPHLGRRGRQVRGSPLGPDSCSALFAGERNDGSWPARNTRYWSRLRLSEGTNARFDAFDSSNGLVRTARRRKFGAKNASLACRLARRVENGGEGKAGLSLAPG